MSDLKTILQKFKGKNAKIFKTDGKFTKKGHEIYCDFCSLLHELGTIVECLNAEEIESELDKIVKYEK